jgi:hypothetical protein
MGKLSSDVNAKALAEIARDVTVAALNGAKPGADGVTGTAIGKMFAEALKEIANAEI